MKLKSVLLAGAVAALPLGAFAQNDPPPPQRQQTTTQKTTTTTNEAGETKETKVITVTGTVQSFEAGHSITIVNDKGEPMTYTLIDTSEVPKTVEVGKTVTIRTTTASGSPVVKTITTTTTKETKKKSY
jgi:hypothetical protein